MKLKYNIQSYDDYHAKFVDWCTDVVFPDEIFENTFIANDAMIADVKYILSAFEHDYKVMAYDMDTTERCDTDSL